MKNKFKALLAAFVGLFAFSAVAFGVNAMSLSADSKTASWSTNDMDGLLNGSKGTYSGSKFSAVSTLNIKSKCLLIPVVSASSEGKIAIVGTGNQSSRYVYLMSGDGSASSTSIAMSKTSQDINFTSTNVIQEAGKYYVGLTAVNGSNEYDYKISTISLTLTSDEVYASQVLISYYLKGQSSSFETKNLDSGSVLNPSVTLWGYNITGYYSDAECSTAWNSSATISTNTNVYCTYEPWEIEDSNTLDFSLIGKGYNVFGEPTFTSKTKLTGTIYSVLPGGTCFSSSAVKIDESTTTTAAIKTGGKLNNNQNGLEFTVSSAGTLTIFAKNGSSTEVNIALFKDGNTATSISEVTPTSVVTKYELTVPEAGTYQLGSAEGSVYFYYVSFVDNSIKTPVLEQQENANHTAVRYICTLSNVLDYSQVESWTVTMSLSGKDDYTVTYTNLYVAVAGENGKEAAINTYYLVATLKGIPSSYNGQELSCKFTVKLSNGSVLESNVLKYTIDVLEA